MIKMIYVIFVIFLVGNIIFISKRKHLLIILIRLEFIVLRIYFLIIIYLIIINNNIYLLIVFLVLTVCEGALGLSILVSIVRTYGNDYFQRFNLI